VDFEIISAGLKNGWSAFKKNAVAYIVGLIIVAFGSCLVVTVAPLFYGLYYMAIKGSRGDKVEIKDVFCGFKSIDVFIRSWVFWIIYFIVLIIIGATSLIFENSSVFAQVGPLLSVLLSLIWGLIAFFSIYIYIMTPSENVIYAYKEGFNIVKDNLLMAFVAYVVYTIVAVIGSFFAVVGLLVTVPIALVFAVAIMKALKPDIKDESE